MSSTRMTTARADGLDKLSHTFTRDKEFCEALAATHAWSIGRLFVYLRWALNYLPAIQEELHSMVAQHFAEEYRYDAGYWTLSLTGGIYKDLGLVPYLAVRGLVPEAGIGVRRGLENAGLLAQLWQDPTKAEYLSGPDTVGFRNAFVREANKAKADNLKAEGVQKRFAECHFGKPMSHVYTILSEYSIHGGSPNQLITSQVERTRVSCMLVNRPDPLEKGMAGEFEILGNGCEMVCFELALIHGTFGAKYGLLPSKGGEGGYYLTTLLERGPDSEISRLIQATLQDFGWAGREVA